MNSWIKATMFGAEGPSREIWINMARVIIMRQMRDAEGKLHTQLNFTSGEFHNVVETPEELFIRVALRKDLIEGH